MNEAEKVDSIIARICKDFNLPVIDIPDDMSRLMYVMAISMSNSLTDEDRNTIKKWLENATKEAIEEGDAIWK